MAGYCGYSMSNNAVDAYNNGEKPISKWKKQDILSEIQELDIDLKCDFAKLQKAPSKSLKGTMFISVFLASHQQLL